MTPTTEVRVPIVLDKERFMVFNANTMNAFEQKTGKFFLDVLAKLHEALKPYIEYRAKIKINEVRRENGEEELPLGDRVSILDVTRKVSTTDLTALLWASLHEYKDNGDPYWPLTLGQVGRFVHPKELFNIYVSILHGHAENSPSKEELGESQAGRASGNESTRESGGEPGIALQPGDFA